MTQNPYDSPSFSSATKYDQNEGPGQRPTGVSILAILHLLGGILLLGSQVLLFANFQAVERSLRMAGIPPVLLIAGAMFLAVLGIGSGVGMWLGSKWGWWLASFYYVYSIFRNASALFTVASMADELEGTERGPEYYMMKHGGRAVVSFLLLLYFFKGNVLEYFGLPTLSKAKAIGILVGLCSAITAGIFVLGLLLN